MGGKHGVELVQGEVGLGEVVADSGSGRDPAVAPAQLHREERPAGLQEWSHISIFTSSNPSLEAGNVVQMFPLIW